MNFSLFKLRHDNFNKDNARYRRDFRRWRLRMKITSIRYWWTALVAVVILGVAESVIDPPLAAYGHEIQQENLSK